MPRTASFRATLALGSALLAAACAEPATTPPAEASAQDTFWQALSSHCGQAYSGELVSSDPVDADFSTADMVMHVRECSDDRIAVPFHVKTGDDWDRSRTWLITRTESGLRLKHDHRHEDGSSDAVTMYGGDTAEAGTKRMQAFAVDAESVDMFGREGLDASVTNVWTLEVDPAGEPGGVFAYQLKRTVQAGAPEDRLFRVEFDLTNPVDPPPSAWGHD